MIQMKKMVAAVAIAAASIGGAQATTLAAGDISFTGFARESAYGGWSFVSWVNLDAGTVITFSDNGLNSAGAFKTSVQKENTWTWTATSAVSAGTQVVTYGGTFDTTLGTVSGGVSGGGATTVSTGTLAPSATSDSLPYAFDFSSSGEVLYALQGTTFIGAINNFVSTPATTSDNPLTSGLTNIQNINYGASLGGTGDSVIQRTEWYKGPTTGLSAADYKLAIANMANWSKDTATANLKSLGLLEGNGQIAVATGPAFGVGAGNFTIAAAPVPEASTYAMLLAGLGMIGVIARRRTNA